MACRTSGPSPLLLGATYCMRFVSCQASLFSLPCGFISAGRERLFILPSFALPVSSPCCFFSSQVKQRHRLMEDRVAEEKQKTSAAEAKAAKLQAKNKSLSDENTKLRQILQQIQVS